MLRGIQGKRAVVTGAGGAIGAATVRRLVAEGARCVAVDLNGAPLGSLVNELGSNAVIPVAADISDSYSNDRVIEIAAAELGGIDLFFANAGVESAVTDVAVFSEAEYRRVLDVNVLGSFLGARAVVRVMLDQPNGGNILFTASTGALKGVPGLAVYVASKHAVLGLARSLALEVGGRGIRVNALCPGPVDTRMMQSIGRGTSERFGITEHEARARTESATALGRFATAEEIASTASWMLSDECRYMHNEVVTVTGGGV